jgi:hypothetical protein
MKVGVYGHTHGIGYRDDTNQFLKSPPEQREAILRACRSVLA